MSRRTRSILLLFCDRLCCHYSIVLFLPQNSTCALNISAFIPDSISYFGPLPFRLYCSSTKLYVCFEYICIFRFNRFFLCLFVSTSPSVKAARTFMLYSTISSGISFASIFTAMVHNNDNTLRARRYIYLGQKSWFSWHGP